MPINIIPGGPPPPPLIGFIDAGYLKAGSARSLGVGSTDVTVDAAGVVSWLRGAAGFGGSFLRAYWYEGAFDGGDARYVSEAVDDALRKARKRGRPSLSEAGESPLLRVRISHDLDEAVRRAAERTGTTRTDWVRQVLSDAARKAG